jgi:AcrR family transcriptional regulator
MPENPSTGEARQRRTRSSVTAHEILRAAEEVATAGFEALTMRAVAQRMGASPMSLYRYFATKDELIDAMLDRVLGRIQLPAPSGDWVADLGRFAMAHRQVLRDHPWAIVPLFTHSNPGINGSVIGESALAILERGGVLGDAAVASFSAILALNYGWFAFNSARDGRRSETDPEADLAASLAQLPPERFPLTVSVAPQLSGYGSEEQYAMALRRVVAGVAVSGNS